MSINITTSAPECALCVWNYILMALLRFCLNQLNWKSSWTQFLSSNCLSIHITLVTVKDLLVQLFSKTIWMHKGVARMFLWLVKVKFQVADLHQWLHFYYKTYLLRESSKFRVPKKELSGSSTIYVKSRWVSQNADGFEGKSLWWEVASEFR